MCPNDFGPWLIKYLICLQEIAEPLLYSRVSIDSSDTASWTLLAMSVTENPRLGELIKHLEVDEEADFMKISPSQPDSVYSDEAIEVLGRAPNIESFSHQPPMQADACKILKQCSNLTVLDIALTINEDINDVLETLTYMGQLKSLSVYWRYAQCTIPDLAFIPGFHMLMGLHLPELSHFSWMCPDIENRNRSFECGLRWLNTSQFAPNCDITIQGPGVYFDRDELAPFYRNHADGTWKVDNVPGDGLVDALRYIRGDLKCALWGLASETTLFDSSAEISSLPRLLTITLGSLGSVNKGDAKNLSKVLNALSQRDPQALTPSSISLEHGYRGEIFSRTEAEHHFGEILTSALLEKLRAARITLVYA